MSKKKIVVSEYDNIAALFEDDRAVEFIIHRGDILLGDIFLATVENILPSIDAAFVHVGSDKMGFLHASDVPGKGDLRERLKPKQQLVVQVMKEPTGHKGPRVTTSISLPGRFLVMMPESKGVSISRKVTDSKERSRLKSIVSMIKPPGVGVIIRTEATGQSDADIQDDFETLLERWQAIVSMADTAKPPKLLYRDQDLLYRVIREVVTEDVKDIIVDSSFGQQRAQQLLQNWNMEKGMNVSHYTGSQPIMIGAGIDREIRQALQTKVSLPSGGYLYIQTTEALTVIDVNSGKFTSLQSQAATIRHTNLESCKEIARQLRLRNIGGMIIVDFIDMESRADQLSILETFENELEGDKSKPQIGGLSDLGLVEMTRHRQGQALAEIFGKKCSSCAGHGHVIEDFNWSPSSIHGNQRDSRGGGRNNRERHKLPIKSSRNQNVSKPKAMAGKNNKHGPSDRLPQNRGKKQTALEERFLPWLPPIGQVFLNRDGVNATEKAVEDKKLREFFVELSEQRFGTALAVFAQASNRPQGANSILSRINPKSNDVMTLVRSIETQTVMPMHHYDDDGSEDESDEDESDEGQEEGQEDNKPQGRNNRNQGRNNRNQGRNNRNQGRNNRNDNAPANDASNNDGGDTVEAEAAIVKEAVLVPSSNAQEVAESGDSFFAVADSSDDSSAMTSAPSAKAGTTTAVIDNPNDAPQDADTEEVKVPSAPAPRRGRPPAAAKVQQETEQAEAVASEDDSDSDDDDKKPKRRGRPPKRSNSRNK